jgi:hypothetical protein
MVVGIGYLNGLSKLDQAEYAEYCNYPRAGSDNNND